MTWRRRAATLGDRLLRPRQAERNAASAADSARDEVQHRAQMTAEVAAMNRERTESAPPDKR